MPTPESPEPLTVPLATAATMLGISRRTAYNLVDRGAFPVPILRIGNSVKVSRALLETYINAQAEASV